MDSKFKESKKLFSKSKEKLASGVASNLRLAMKPVPIFAKSANGSRVTDVDNNEYIDYIMAYGPQILGHAHPHFSQSVCEQSKIGQAFGAQHEGEIELAEKLTKYVNSADLVSYSSTGSEAVHTAVRLARAYTGKNKVVRFEGHYHGWYDTIFTSATGDGKVHPGTKGQDQNALNEVIQIPWNEPHAVEDVFKEYGDQIACVLTEPFMCNSGCISPLPGYMEKLRDITMEYNALLIFDEVITGFRLGLGGAQDRLGITPDLATFGKAIAGGMPLSAVCGKKEVMKLIADSEVFHMGTLNGNPLCTSGAIATIEVLEENDGKKYEEMNDLSTKLTDGLMKIAKKHSIPLTINNLGSVFNTMIVDREVSTFEDFSKRDVAAFSKLAEYLLEEGVMVRPSGLWYLSTSHTEDDVEETLRKFEKAAHRFAIEHGVADNYRKG